MADTSATFLSVRLSHLPRTLEERDWKTTTGHIVMKGTVDVHGPQTDDS